MKKSILLYVFICLSVFGYSQNALPVKVSADLDKAIELFKAGNRKKGIENTRKILDSYPDHVELWDILTQMHVQDLAANKEAFNTSFEKVIIAALSDNKKTKSKSPDVDVLGEYLQSQFALDFFLREATLKAKLPRASRVLRTEKVDPAKPDSLVGADAKNVFYEAEKLFINKDYKASASKYREALALAKGYYFSAELYLGDAYYMIGEFDSSTKYFKSCTQTFPQYIEPHKYLADSYGKQYEFEKSIDACINGIFIYPDVSLFMKIEDATKLLRKKYNDGWIARGCFPYYRKSNTTDAVGPWADYISYSQKAWEGSDTLGVISNPSLFENEKYAEVYAWKKMLEKHQTNPELAFARDMQSKGYLDCYVFISLYHYDFLNTYRHFILNNKEKATTYLREVVISK